MVRIVLRALGTTLLTVTVLGVIVATRAGQGQDGPSERAPTVVTLGDLPEALPGLGPEVQGAVPAEGVPAVFAALRAYLEGEAAPEPVPEAREEVRPEEPEGVRVNLGRPSGSGNVRVNRGLP